MVAAVIVAAGRGTRMGPGTDKLLLEVKGCPILAHTWRRFDQADCIDEIVLVSRPDMESVLVRLVEKYGFRKPHRFVHGGRERQDSVWNGISVVGDDVEVVAIQDAARPCTDTAVIRATIEAAFKVGAAVAAERVVDTIKESADGHFIDRTLDRSRLWAVQTPQTFRTSVIRRALAAVREQGLSVTDDTAACELIGQKVKLVESFHPNPKVTQPGDLPYIEHLL